MLAFMVDLCGKRIVVVGGGAVGRRKALLAQNEGADIRVIALEPPPADWPFTWIVEPYRIDHLRGADLVFAAATPTVNTQVVADAKSLGIWVNSASNPDDGDVLVPATIRRGMLHLAFSTEGASPAFARRFREKMEAEIDDAYGEFLALLAELRDRVLANVPDPAKRRRLLDDFGDWKWLARMRADGVRATRAAMIELIQAE